MHLDQLRVWGSATHCHNVNRRAVHLQARKEMEEEVKAKMKQEMASKAAEEVQLEVVKKIKKLQETKAREVGS